MLGLNQVYQATVEDLAFGGDGLVRVNGKVVFIPFVLPGEEITFEIIHERKDYARAKLQKLLNKSPERVVANCSVYEKCGGCQFQHINYDHQVQVKDLWLHQTLKSVQEKPIQFDKPAAAKKAWGYRERIRLHRGSNSSYGFNQRQSNNVVSISSCPIAASVLNEALRNSQTWKGQEVELIADTKERLLQLTEQGHENSNNSLTRRLKGKELRTTGNSFFQIHSSQNEVLIDSVLDFLGTKQGKRHETVWDLYAGNGNFSIFLSEYFRRVFSVEENPTTHKDAVWNAKQNQVENMDCFCDSVASFLTQTSRGYERPGAIVLDPPRKGAKDVLSLICNSKCQKIVYVSCDLATLKRDLMYFVANDYHILRARMIDMFPQTYHMESVVLLERV